MSIQILRPDFKRGDQLSLTSVAYELAVRYPVSSRVAVVVNLPLAHVGVKPSGTGLYQTRGSSSTGVGNPYFGIASLTTQTVGTWAEGEIGIRPPLAQEEDAQTLGLFADIDQIEAFPSKTLTLQGAARFRLRTATGGAFSARLAPRLMYYTGEGRFDDRTNIYFGYGVFGGFDDDATRIVLGLTGLYNQDARGDIGQRTVHQLGIDGGHWFGTVRAGVRIQLPLDQELDDVIKAVYGLNLSFRLAQP